MTTESKEEKEEGESSTFAFGKKSSSNEHRFLGNSKNI
jgi:hypothetical protein